MLRKSTSSARSNIERALKKAIELFIQEIIDYGWNNVKKLSRSKITYMIIFNAI